MSFFLPVLAVLALAGARWFHVLSAGRAASERAVKDLVQRVCQTPSLADQVFLGWPDYAGRPRLWLRLRNGELHMLGDYETSEGLGDALARAGVPTGCP